MTTTLRKLSKPRVWVRGLLAAIIGGSASAGGAYLGMNSAHAMGIEVPQLNLQSLGVILLSSGLFHAFTYLAKSPIPSADEETSET